jgi:GTP cyclohydrolase I
VNVKPAKSAARAGSNGDAERLARPVDQERIQSAVREILEAIGEDPDRDGLRETPQRVARAYAELFSGLRQDPSVLLRKTFVEPCNEIVLERDVPFQSMCEHHLLPFEGVAHIAYLPFEGRIVGISKLARVLEVLSRRPQVQERMTNQLADLIEKELRAKAVACVLDATHSCMTIRGVRKPGSRVVTSALRGRFRTDSASRAEVMSLIFSHTK